MDDRRRQRDLFTKRWRAVKEKAPSEVELQIALNQHVAWRKRPGVVHFHVPNGEERDRRVGAKLKAMGVLPGVADLVFVWIDDDGRLRNLYLELKARGGKASAAQLLFAREIRAAGAAYEIADDLDGALKLLDHHGVLKMPKHLSK